MIFLHGTYRWFPRRSAFRRDDCRSCGGESTSFLLRTFHVLHVFWIPLLPLGFWSRWLCVACGQQPHAAVGTRRGFKIAGAVALAFIAIAFWFVEPDAEMGPALVWSLRLGAAIALWFAIRSIRRQQPSPDFKALLESVQPHRGTECLLCGGPMVVGRPSACGVCGARHLPLSRRVA